MNSKPNLWVICCVEFAAGTSLCNAWHLEDCIHLAQHWRSHFTLDYFAQGRKMLSLTSLMPLHLKVLLATTRAFCVSF